MPWIKGQFLPLLLLVIQPNRMLGVDDVRARLEVRMYRGALERVEGIMKGVESEPSMNLKQRVYTSENKKVQDLLDRCRHVVDDDNLYPRNCIAVIKQHFPGVVIGAIDPLERIKGE